MENELIQALNTNTEIELPESIAIDNLEKVLAEQINQLILLDFEKLVSLLYRIDVSEKKLKDLLHKNPAEDVGKIIAQLIIERQWQKIKTKKDLKEDDKNISEEEKW